MIKLLGIILSLQSFAMKVEHHYLDGRIIEKEAPSARHPGYIDIDMVSDKTVTQDQLTKIRTLNTLLVCIGYKFVDSIEEDKAEGFKSHQSIKCTNDKPTEKLAGRYDLKRDVMRQCEPRSKWVKDKLIKQFCDQNIFRKG